MVLCGIQVVWDLGSVGFVKKFNKRLVGRFLIDSPVDLSKV